MFKRSLILAAVFAALPAWGQVRLVDRAAAVVNGEMIPLSELQQRIAPDLKRLADEGRATVEARVHLMRLALDDLIADKLLQAEQKAQGEEVTEQDIDLAVEDVRKQAKMDAATFERALMAQNLSLSEYRERLRRELAAIKLLGKKVRSRIKVSDEDVRAEYLRRAKLEEGEFEIHARQIVIQVPEGATSAIDEAARKRADDAARRARAGEDFAALAQKLSDSPSKAQGGEMGWFQRGEMLPVLDKAAFALEVGQISAPVRTPFGWHVLQVTERRPVAGPAFEDVKDDLRERIFRERMAAQTDLYIKGLRQKASIQILIPELNP